MRLINLIRRNARATRQILLILGTFIIIEVVFVVQINIIMRNQLKEGAMEILRTSEANIRASLKWQESALASASQAIGFITSDSEDPSAEVLAFLRDFSDWLVERNDSNSGSDGLYGYLFGEFMDGGGWTPPGSYLPQSRPWYIAAREGRGSIVAIDPYVDSSTGETVVTFATELFDGAGDYGGGASIGVLAMDVLVTSMTDKIRETRITSSGYGMLLDAGGKVICDVDGSMIGRELSSLYPWFDSLKAELDEGGESASHTYTHFQTGKKRVCEFKKIYNGWYLGIITPEREYFSGMFQTIATITVLFSAMALGLGTLFVLLSGRQMAAEEERSAAILANESKSKFLATVSHEIRTPLGAIIGIAQIQMNGASDPKEQADCWEKVYTSGNTLLGIINDILDLSKIESGKLELSSTEYNTPTLINDAVQLNIVRIHSKPIRFVLAIDKTLPMRLFGDELRIKQVLCNILSNSFKYTASGTVTLSVTHETNGAGTTLIFTVTDTGQGMTQEQLKKLFDAYSRFNAEANRNTEGTGLGMNITGKIVSMMNGKIAVESEINKGTVFTVSLPQVPVSKEIIGAALAEKLRTFTFNRGEIDAKLPKISTRRKLAGRVMVVDDVETNLFVAEKLMKPFGVRVKTVQSGFEAVELIAFKRTYDIIFLDHMMPGMDGIETCSKLRAMGYKGPIVALTANAIVGSDKMFRKNGFDEFLSKPIDVRKLESILRMFIKPAEGSAGASGLPIESAGAAGIAIEANDALFEAFNRDAIKAVAVLRETMRSGDIKLFTTTAHAMKSALFNIGEDEKSELAHALETAGKSDDWIYINSHAEPFIALLESLIRTPDEAPETLVCEDLALLNEKLAVISAACADYDDNTAMVAIEELLRTNWKRETGAALSAMKVALFSDSDFDRAKEIADTLLL